MNPKEIVVETTNTGSEIHRNQLSFNNSADLTFLLGVDDNRYRFITVNDAFLNAGHLTREQVEGKYVEEVIPVNLYPFIIARYNQAVKERQTVEWEDTFDYPDGRRTGIVNVTPIFNEAGVCTMLAGTLHDITERKKAEEALIARGQQLDLIYNTVGDIIFLLSVEEDLRYRFTSVNNAFVAATGLSHEMVEGKYADETIPPGSRTLVLNKYGQAIREKRTIQWEETTEYPAGKKTGIVSITPVFNNGKCTSLVGTVHDITDRKIALEEKERVSYLLNERIKELTTLYRADQILQKENLAIDKMLQEFVNILSQGWQFPGITEACIVLGDKKYMTAGYLKDVSCQAATFEMPDGIKGTIEVIYTEERPEEAEGPFLIEERNLINMLAEKLRVHFAKKGAGDQLLREKELSDKIIETLPGLFYMIDENGRYIKWNKLKETITGYTHEEMLRMNSVDFFEGDEKEQVRTAIKKGFETGHTEVEAHVITKDNKKLLHYFTGVTIDYDGKPCLMGMGMDITERRKAAEQLLREKELSESIINSLPGIFYLFDTSGQYLLWNKNHETVPGYTTEEMKTMYPLNFFDDNEKEMIRERIGKVFTEGYAEAEAYFMGKDGKKTPYYFNGIAINYNDKPCLMGVGIDITERKKMETELRDAEIKFRTLVEKSQVGVYIVQRGKFSYVNPRFAEIFGYEPNELIGVDPVRSIIAEEYQAISAEHVRARLEGEVETVHYEAVGRKKDGTTNRIEFYGSRTFYEGQITIIGTMVDITERKIAEEALQKSEANLQSVFDTTDTIYTLLDTNFQVMSFNQQSAEFARNELHSELKLNTNLINYFPGDRWNNVYENMKKVLRGETVNYESGYAQQDGSFHWYHVRMLPVRDKPNNVFGLMIALSDITEKKLLEEQILSQKVEEQKKITRAVLNAQEKERNLIGQELHDNVNQILAGAKMFLGLIKKDGKDNEELLKKSITLIDNAVNEIRDLTRDQVTPQKKIDLKDLIQSLVDKLNEHAHLKTTFDYDVGKVVVNDDLKLNIYRIIQEGINNILKHASARSAVITVKADRKTLFVSIVDDGKGLDTTKKYKGVGINNILNRVDSYNGRIAIDSGPEKGCRIELAIPL